eukprot:TRINITY_DN17_c0_g1_i1.p1 TRINITY_DN17_c0_g1~~TRINITY_DN17_c0_g1_i1.p1  ORF type:complete len:412 (+),score=65.24 TRINITY_DN17_c0_g1_i1:155-1390(+)
MFKIVLLLSFVLLCSQVLCITPRMIHLAYTGDPTTMSVSFACGNKSDIVSGILYGTDPKDLNLQSKGYNFEFQAGEDNVYRINNVIATKLEPDTVYYYQVGDFTSNTWSDVYSFSTKSARVYAIYGDLGEDNDVSMQTLVNEAKNGDFDAVIHLGDFAYDLDSKDGATGDEFFANIEAIASTKPYMPSPGNHERYNNFTQYIKRFSNVEYGAGTLSGSGTNLWYSFDQGLVHWIAIDTEVYAYYVNQNQIDQQLAWLEQDLKKANKNRTEVPWIIMFGHKCWWMTDTNFTAFEELAHLYGVDVYLSGHVHNYERFYPYYNGNIDRQSDINTFVNPKYMVTIVVGSPGNKELIASNLGPSDSLAYYALKYGYSHLKVHNSTYIHFTWEETGSGTGSDSLWIIQNNHGPRLKI